MRLYKELFVGPTVRHKRSQVIWKLKRNKLQLDIFLITLAANPNDLMDILPAFLLKQPYYKNQDLFVLGIAGSKPEAQEIVRQIVERLYQETGGFEIREFVGQQQK